MAHFVQADAIVPGVGNSKSFDRYAYVNNNPLRFIDPSGHAPIIDDDIRGNPIIDENYRPNTDVLYPPPPPEGFQVLEFPGGHTYLAPIFYGLPIYFDPNDDYAFWWGFGYNPGYLGLEDVDGVLNGHNGSDWTSINGFGGIVFWSSNAPGDLKFTNSPYISDENDIVFASGDFLVHLGVNQG